MKAIIILMVIILMVGCQMDRTEELCGIIHESANSTQRAVINYKNNICFAGNETSDNSYLIECKTLTEMFRIMLRTNENKTADELAKMLGRPVQCEIIKIR